MHRTIFHIDMDSFYASVEKRDHPELRDRPVIIGADPKGGKGRGVVATCCYVARTFGVHSAMPISIAYRLCPTGAYLPSDFTKYREVSHHIMEIFESFADSFQPVSIDEAFLDVSERVEEYETARKLAIAIKKEVFLAEKLTCSIGIATNKSIAKIASDFQKPNGITEVLPDSEAEFLAPLPIGKISGIGPKSRKVFEAAGIMTVGELARAEESFLRERIGDYSVGFKYIAMGLDDRPVMRRTGMESMSAERTFMEDTDDEKIIMEKFGEIVEKLHERAIKKNISYRTIGIKVRLSDFTTFTREKSFQVPVNTKEPIYRNVEILWQEFSPPPKKIRLLGVRLSGIERGKPEQRSLEEWGLEEERVDGGG
jgi:DNA polymerase IV (archaeal DinB-like DNA polymerase)